MHSESSSELLNDATNHSNAKKTLEDHSRLLDLIAELREVESQQTPKLPCRDENSWNNFKNWIVEQSASQVDHKLFERVRISSQSSVCVPNNSEEDQEYALFTQVPLKKGETIFSISRKVVLSTETVINDIDLFDFIKKDSIASAMQNVILVLHLLNEYSKEDRSFWWPYLSILPKKILPILKLDKNRLTALLASSHIFEAMKMIRAIARQYSYFYGKLQATNLPISRSLTYEFYCWGVSMVCSRQNEIPSSDRKSSASPIVRALIPILDLCNHNLTSNQAIYEDDQTKLFASAELDIDDEISINYGCRSSGDFFIHNGFVPAKVPFDAMPLTVTLNKSDKLFTTRVKLLRILNMPFMGKFKLTPKNHENRHKRDPHLTMFLIIYLMSEDELDFVMDCDNPVGVADDIYEYLQYNSEPPQDGSGGDPVVSQPNEVSIESMKKRLLKSVRDYLSKRASIGIALIDRTLAEIDPKEGDLVRLLNHEKSIYVSHLCDQ